MGRAVDAGSERPGRQVLIVGAGIAGPALAFWLHRAGFAVTVMERAPRVRPGGQAVDLRGIAREVAAPIGAIDNLTILSTDGAGALPRQVNDNVAQTLQMLKTSTGLDLDKLIHGSIQKAVPAAAAAGDPAPASAPDSDAPG